MDIVNGNSLGVSTKRMAELFGVRQSTILQWIENGKVDALKTPGGHYRIPFSEVDRLKREHTEPASEKQSKRRSFAIRPIPDQVAGQNSLDLL